MPSQQDIARIAGVDRSLVSLALRDHPRVAEATRAKIRRIAEKIGYRPNAALAEAARFRWRNAGGERRETVALLQTFQSASLSRALLIDPLRKRLDELGFGLDLVDPYAFPGDEALSRVLVARGIRGVVMEQMRSEDTDHELDWRRFHVVRCGLLTSPRRRVDEVCVDHGGLVRTALARLAEEGCRRVLIVLNGETGFLSTRLFIQAAEGCRRLAEFRRVVAGVVSWDPSRETEAVLLKKISGFRPDGLICLDSGGLEAVMSLGIVPVEIPAVIMIGDHVRGGVSSRVHWFAPQLPIAARFTAEMMAAGLAGHAYGLPQVPRRVVFIPPWQDGR